MSKTLSKKLISISGGLSKLVAGIANHAIGIGLASAAIGAITMALINQSKKINALNDQIEKSTRDMEKSQKTSRLQAQSAINGIISVIKSFGKESSSFGKVLGSVSDSMVTFGENLSRNHERL